ncbi:hypothetical protein HPB47_028229 [Ixodes persulcatus]|uniref:Uncharacterized protein n=1 Tax=Ixodes persulcatus TaxID=34615 RepID=A0AC60PTU9_IXOPE|nr:hypothetical protein HPB47_028229 [Ixodes persulcatus]
MLLAASSACTFRAPAGVPISVICTYTEAFANTIGNHLQKRALGHLIRITTCESAAPLLARIAERPESRLGQLLSVLGDVAGPSPSLIHCHHSTRHHTRWPSTPTSTGWAHVEKQPTWRPDSWPRTTSSSTAPVGGAEGGRASCIPGDEHHHRARRDTSRTAPRFLCGCRGPDDWLPLSDSQAALAQLYSLERASPLAREIAGEVLLLESLGHRLAFQWVSSYCGIPGNESANNLAERVHDEAAFRTSDIGPFADAKLLVARAAAEDHPDQRCAAGDRLARLPRNANRQVAAVVHRIQNGCTRTPSWLHHLRRETDPDCPTCGEWADLDHLLLDRAEHADARASMMATFAALGLTCGTKEEILRPRGDKRCKDRALRALLTFLEDTGLLFVPVSPVRRLGRPARRPRLCSDASRLE